MDTDATFEFIHLIPDGTTYVDHRTEWLAFPVPPAPLFDEDLETWGSAGWMLVVIGGCSDWESSDNTCRANYTDGARFCAGADSEWCADGMDAELRTPSIDLSGASALWLEFETYFNCQYNDDDAYVWISTDGGTSWDPTPLVDWTGDVGPSHIGWWTSRPMPARPTSC